MVALEGRFVLVAAARPPLLIKPPPDEISLEMDHDTQTQRRKTSPHSPRDRRSGPGRTCEVSWKCIAGASPEATIPLRPCWESQTLRRPSGIFSS